MEEKPLNHFWRKDGHDYIADIGIMQKAVVVSYCVPSLLDTKNGWYKISNRSFFPFPEQFYNERFFDQYQAISKAESYMKSWVCSLLVPSNEKQLDEDKNAMQVYLALGYKQEIPEAIYEAIHPKDTSSEKTLTNQEVIAAYKTITNYCHSLTLNANDLFMYNCADGVNLNEEHLKWVLPFVHKYPKAGMNAIMCFIRQSQPIKPYLTDEFHQAYAELESINPDMSEDRDYEETKKTIQK